MLAEKQCLKLKCPALGTRLIKESRFFYYCGKVLVMTWPKEDKSLHESFLNYHVLVKRG